MTAQTEMTGGASLIATVVERGLCCGCGTCGGVCPAGWIGFSPRSPWPEPAEGARCSGCSLCLNACPGAQPARGGAAPLGAPAAAVYSGWALSDELRGRAAAGGVATAVALHALEAGLVERVALALPDGEHPGRRRGGMAATAEEVRQGSQSCYCVFPYNKVLREIVKEGKTVLFIGLPCHLQGVEKAARSDRRLASLIRYRLALFCGYNSTFEATRQAAARCGVDAESGAVSAIRYREGSYPGSFSVQLAAGGAVSLPLSEFRKLIPGSVPRRCLLCSDGTGVAADLSCGDLYGFGASRTCVVVRSDRGEDLLQGATAAGKISRTPLSREEAEKGVLGYMTQYHVRWPLALNRFLERKGKPAVSLPLSPQISVTTRDTADAALHYAMVMFLQRPALGALFDRVPSLRFALGGVVGSFPGWRVYRGFWNLFGKIYRAVRA